MVSRTWLCSTASRCVLKSSPSRGTLPCTAATVTVASLPAPAPERLTGGHTMMLANSTRQMQIPGSTTAGGASAVSAEPVARVPARLCCHHATISSVIAVRLQPISTIAVDNTDTPPRRTSGRNGPSVWPAATTPHGNPPNGIVHLAHSCAAHNSVNQIGQPGSPRTTTASNPKRAGNSAQTMTSAANGIAPTSLAIQGSNDR